MADIDHIAYRVHLGAIIAEELTNLGNPGKIAELVVKALVFFHLANSQIFVLEIIAHRLLIQGQQLLRRSFLFVGGKALHLLHVSLVDALLHLVVVYQGVLHLVVLVRNFHLVQVT